MSFLGSALTIGVTIFMVQDFSPDLRQAPFAVAMNGRMGILADLVLTIGLARLASTLLYVMPQTATLGAILLSAFIGGAIMTHLRGHGDARDVAENVLISASAWAGLWLRDTRIRTLLPIRWPRLRDS